MRIQAAGPEPIWNDVFFTTTLSIECVFTPLPRNQDRSSVLIKVPEPKGIRKALSRSEARPLDAVTKGRNEGLRMKTCIASVSHRSRLGPIWNSLAYHVLPESHMKLKACR